MVNEITENNPTTRVEGIFHATLLPDNDAFISLIVALIVAPEAGPEGCDEMTAWQALNASPTKCEGVVTQWRDPAIQALCRLGAKWMHLQLVAYTNAYPVLVDQITTVVGVAHGTKTQPSAELPPHPVHR